MSTNFYGMFRAKLIYCHTVSMKFGRAGYRYISFALNLPIENAMSVDISEDHTF